MWIRHGVVASVLLVTLAGCSSDSGPEATSAASSPATPTTTETATADPVVNGRILSETEYFARARRACDGCDISYRDWFEAFDTAAGRVSFWWRKGYRAFTLVGPDGERARMACGAAFACPRPKSDRPGLYGRNAAIVAGPGTDEFSVWSPTYHPRSAQQTVRVIGFDGALRRTINLSARLPSDARVFSLAWSPEGTRLAVTTRPIAGTVRASDDARPSGPGGRFSRIWLIEGDGDAQLVHTASSYDGRVPKRYEGRSVRALGHIYGTSWSPDGSRLGFAEHYGPTSPSGRLTWYSFATRVFSLVLPEAGQDGPGAATKLHEYRGFPGGGNFDAVVWSPDGTRVAFRKWRRAFELSAEDGRVLARHAIKDYGLVWPAKQP